MVPVKGRLGEAVPRKRRAIACEPFVASYSLQVNVIASR